MEDVDELLAHYGKASNEDKLDVFDQSSTVQLLVDYGYPVARVKSAHSRMGQGFTSAWLNTTNYFPVPVGVMRVFSFSFEDLFTRKTPHTHPLCATFLEVAVCDLKDAWIISKAYGIGRLLLTRRQITGLHVRIPLPDGTMMHLRKYTGAVRDVLGQTDDPTIFSP